MAILHTYQPAVELVARHAERFRPLLTHTFELGEFDQARSRPCRRATRSRSMIAAASA